MNDEERRARLRPHTLLFALCIVAIVLGWFGVWTEDQVEILLLIAILGMVYRMVAILLKDRG